MPTDPAESGDGNAAQSLRFAGRGGDELPGFLVRDAGRANGSGLLLIHGEDGCDGGVLDVARRFAADGATVLAPDLFGREGAPVPFASLPDRRALGDLDGALSALGGRDDVDEDRVAVVGLGAGGTFAFLFGCHSGSPAAVVSVGGRVVYAELSAEKPIQPLEMALNLSAPFLGLYGAEDARAPGADVETLRRTLEQFAKPFEIVRLEGAGRDFFHDTRPGYHEPAARAAWERITAFLGPELGLEAP